MKKIGLTAIATIFALYTFCMPVSAKENSIKGNNIEETSHNQNNQLDTVLRVKNSNDEPVQIFERDNIKINDSAYKVRSEFLIGTSLENSEILVTDNGVYVNGERKNSVSVTVGGVLVGFLIDGVITYVTGYSGGALVAATLRMLVAFVSAHPLGFIVAVLLVTLAADSVKQYTTKSGNTCVIKPSGNGYNCMYSA